MFSSRFSNTVGIQECTLQHEPAKTVYNPDDRVPQTFFISSERGKVVYHGLAMLVKKILTGVLVFVCKDVRIITIDEDVGVKALFLEGLRQ